MAAAPPRVPAAWQDVAGELPPTWVDALGFLEGMVAQHGETMEKVTCHCCNQSLASCAKGTIARAPGACPPL